MFLIVIALATGWIVNVVKFTRCDFEPPYKAEVIRGICIFVVPAGVIAGYINIKD